MNPLSRFLDAQAGGVYQTALAELRDGAKRSHWMWFIFPQLAGLGRSETARRYAIADLDEAVTFACHEELGARLVESTEAMLAWRDKRTAETILGSVDARKFHSSMTLFVAAAPDSRPFAAALGAFFGGTRDSATTVRL